MVGGGQILEAGFSSVSGGREHHDEHGRRRRYGVALLAAALLLNACYHARISFPDTAPQGLEPRSKTLWSLWWGLSQQNVEPRDCPSASLSEVTTSTNLGYVLLTVVTLGIVSPVHVEFRCAKFSGGGEIP